MQDKKKVKIVEVGPRDGFQIIKPMIPTAAKLQIIDTMINSGVSAMEITSFVNSKAVPQMADATEVAEYVVKKYGGSGFEAIALVPNLYGAAKAYDAGLRSVTYVISASEEHNKANINRTCEQSLAELKNIVNNYPDLHLRLGLATSFGCPFIGKVNEELVFNIIESVQKLGVKTIILADTIGVANPKQVSELVKKVMDKFPELEFVLHLHDTWGMGLANIMAGLEAGITSFETSVAGLGGCPFAPGAAGNIATEDAVNMLRTMGIETGIDLSRSLEAVNIVREKIKDDLTSHMAYAHMYENM